jgi:hypothetical protein
MVGKKRFLTAKPILLGKIAMLCIFDRSSVSIPNQTYFLCPSNGIRKEKKYILTKRNSCDTNIKKSGSGHFEEMRPSWQVSACYILIS